MTSSAQTLAPSEQRVPWQLGCAALAVTCALVGVHWDISWHRSIGRDTFWTPPHVVIYLCGVLAGLASGTLILPATLRPPSATAAQVRVLGFRGPLGAFMLAWGCIAMLTSAPFDDWWHNTYGLDVKIISPPHVLLALGLFTIHIGALVLVQGWQNATGGAGGRVASGLRVYLGAMMVVALMAFMMEPTDRTVMHAGAFYRDVCLALPFVLIGVSYGSSSRWAATWVAGVFTAFQLAFLWILPLFPATPKLGPVLVQVTHFVPPPFPVLLIIPALAVDGVRQRWPGLTTRGWKGAALLGVAFLVPLLAVQWPFASFLVSPASRTWIFGTGLVGYDELDADVFLPESGTWLAINLGLAVVLGVVSSRVGLGFGAWLKRVRR